MIRNVHILFLGFHFQYKSEDTWPLMVYPHMLINALMTPGFKISESVILMGNFWCID